jgi:hypothetical protein
MSWQVRSGREVVLHRVHCCRELKAPMLQMLRSHTVLNGLGDASDSV